MIWKIKVIIALLSSDFNTQFREVIVKIGSSFKNLSILEAIISSSVSSGPPNRGILNGLLL